ncbi:MAG: (d)CMP kinase [Ornithinimicrobium sp.]
MTPDAAPTSVPAATSATAGARTIAIDGPSGSGKSSVSRAVAIELGLRYLDTGAMFRALTWWCVEQRVDLRDQDRVAQAARDLPLSMGTDPQDPHVRVAESTIDAAIRTPEISAAVSAVATNPQVRTQLADEQRRIIAEARLASGGIVVEGRDITTVIAPEAEHRILLSASEDARLQRRSAELDDRGQSQDAQDVRDQVLRRDRDDATVSAFFTPAEGVHGIDTSALTFAQSVAAVLDVVRQDSAAHTGATDHVSHPPTSTPGA